MVRRYLLWLRVCLVGLLVVLAHASWFACGNPSQVESLGGPVRVESLSGPVATVESPTHGFLGIVWDPKRELTVARVAPGTSAAAGGLMAEDVITSINGHPVSTGSEAPTFLKDTEPGDAVDLEFKRGNQSMSLRVELTSYADLIYRERSGESTP